MKPNHTPGPWRTLRKAGQNEIEAATFPHTRMVAAVFAIDAQDEANTRLIAAAPELYDALRQMVLNTQAEPFIAASLEKARAALAKAEGRP